jgi:uncharacterized PurR-regulated membrane protein YhhQ (DUF165 family)
MKRLFSFMTKEYLLIILVAALSVVGVFMNLFTSLRWVGAPGLTFGNVFFTWIPMLVGDVLIEVYGRKKGIAIPAFIYLLQGLFFLVAVVLVSTRPEFLVFRTIRGTDPAIEIFPVMFSDTFQIWFGSVLANYAGFLTNGISFILLRKYLPNRGTWLGLGIAAIVSSFLGQAVDNTIFMTVGLNMFDIVSLGWRQLAEVGMEVVFFPVTIGLISYAKRLPSASVVNA